MVKKNVIVLIIPLFCLSCGIEDIPYLDYIQDISPTDTSARFVLPSLSADGYNVYFARFEIYYRIYISGNSFKGVIIKPELLNQINGSLNSDYNGLYPLTNKTNTSVNPSNLDITFNNRRYFKLALEGADIDNLLGSGSLGGTLEIRFSTVNGEQPELILNNGVPYTLQRANSGPSVNFSPRPNRNFLNHSDLYNTANATNLINADAAVPNPTQADPPGFTYVSMYIFAVGRDYITTIYSQPTHIGIFHLAEAL
jgi:hypothetical protein